MTIKVSEFGMKASELTLDHFNNISEKSQRSLKDLKLTLNSTDAWGLLRKDLINALGVQRAKRFLLRYGYHCGVHEARIYKEAFNWKNDLEWLIAGSKAHDLFGRVFSYPENFKVDMEKGLFNVSGYWIDSFEAKQHLQNFSEYNEPVCFYLIGYASGYNSECLGKKVIFKEVKCKGKGDDHCSYIGKTIDEWGAEISEELLYFEDEDMSGELDQMYRKVENQKEKLEISYSISRNLTQAMLQGEGFSEFARILGQSQHCQVYIQDKRFQELARYGDAPGMEHYMSAKNIWDEANEIHSTNTIIETNLPDKTFKLLTIPFMVKKQVYGFITITLSQKQDSFLKDILERVATIAALHMQNERVAIETEQRLKGEMLEQLLNNKESNASEIYNRFSYLGYNLMEPHYILHIEIHNCKMKGNIKYDNFDYLEIRNKITNFLFQKNHNSNTLILTKLNTVQAIISKQFIENENSTIKNFGEQLLKQIGTQEHQIYIGISNETEQYADFYRKAVEAKKAVELAKIRSSNSSVILSNELGYSMLFLSAKEPEELEEFANKVLHPILEYDAKKNAELLQSLFYYSENEFNLHKTARQLSISISGMRYRVQKMEDLLFLDLSNSNTRFEIQLSLQIFLMLGKIKF